MGAFCLDVSLKGSLLTEAVHFADIILRLRLVQYHAKSCEVI